VETLERAPRFPQHCAQNRKRHRNQYHSQRQASRAISLDLRPANTDKKKDEAIADCDLPPLKWSFLKFPADHSSISRIIRNAASSASFSEELSSAVRMLCIFRSDVAVPVSITLERHKPGLRWNVVIVYLDDLTIHE
jgi:hypothetical protein